MSNKRCAAALFAAAAISSSANAQSDYGSALQHIEKGRFHEAKAELRPIASSGCKAMASYLLGYVSAHLYHLEDTIRESSRSLACEPALRPKYRDGSLQLLNWAALNLAGYRIKLKIWMSDGNGGSRDLAKVAAVNSLIDEAARHVPDLRDRLRRAEQSASTLNHLMICIADDSAPQCQDKNPLPQLPLPTGED